MKQRSKSRRLLSCLLALLMMVSMVPVAGASAVQEVAEVRATEELAEVSGTAADGLEYEIDSETVTITGYTGSAKEVTIPSEIDSYPVTSIGNSAFYCCNDLVSITIPDSVTIIGRSAFQDCTNLKNIKLPKSLNSIDENVFYGCVNVESIEIDKDNTVFDSRDNCKAIIETKTNKLLFGCKNTIIPSSVSIIGYRAFAGTTLNSIEIPNNVTSIEQWAFDGCKNLSDIIIPDSVIDIGFGAFGGTGYYDNEKNWQDGVLYIDSILIQGSSAKGTYHIKEGTRLIADSAFWYGSELTNLIIPNSVKYIGDYAFRECTSLTNIIIPEEVTKLSATFAGCTSLCSITIPKSVTHIGSLTFASCISLTDVHYGGTQEEWESIELVHDFNEKLIMATKHFTEKPTEPSKTEFLGDSNGDGKVNVKDATQIQKAVAGLLTLSETEALLADVDGNGKVNVKDATAIQKWVAGIDTGFDIGK